MTGDRLHMTRHDWLFTLSRTENVSNQQMDIITRKIMEMGIKIHTDKQRWSDRITHVIFVSNDKPGTLKNTTQQVLCGLASGCWVIKDSFIHKSYRHKVWQSETDHVAFPSCLEFRKIIEEKGEEGKPFHNMIAVMLSSDIARKTAYFELIKAGGGKTIPNIINFKELNLREWQPGEINHVIIDPFYIREKKEQKHFLFQFMERAQKKLGTVNFLNYKYLSKYLKEGGVISTHDYVIRQADYQDLYKLEKRQRSASRDSAAKKMKPSEVVIDLEEEFEKPVIELSDHSEEEDEDIQCVEEVRVNEQDPSTRLYYESPSKQKDRENKPKVQNYADICKRQKEEAALGKETMHGVCAEDDVNNGLQQDQDNEQGFQEPENVPYNTRSIELDNSSNVDINKDPCDKNSTTSSTDRPTIRLVSMTTLLQGSIQEQQDTSPVPGHYTTTNLLQGSSQVQEQLDASPVPGNYTTTNLLQGSSQVQEQLVTSPVPSLCTTTSLLQGSSQVQEQLDTSPVSGLCTTTNLLQGSSQVQEQLDASPVPGLCTTTSLLDNSISQVAIPCKSPPAAGLSLTVSRTGDELSPMGGMIEGGEYEEHCTDAELNAKPDLSSLPSAADPSSQNYEACDDTPEDVKPDIKPFVAELDMDNLVLERIIAAINKRMKVNRSDFIFTNGGSKTLEYSNKETTLVINKNSSTFFPKIKALYSGNERSLEDTDKIEHLNYIKYNWNINCRFDRATLNYLIVYCLLKEKNYCTRSMAYRLLSKYASLHLVVRSKDRESFISTLLGCLDYDKNQSKLSLSKTDGGLVRLDEWWTNLVKSVISSLKNNASQDITRTGCYMTLELLVNLMVKDFYIWWKYFKTKETFLTLIYYFFQEDIMNGFSTTVLPLYQAFLLHHHNSDLPRRLLSMVYLLTSFLDSKKGDSDLTFGNKVKIVKKLSKCLSSVNLEDNDLYIEVSLLEPSLLSSCVSSNLLTGSSQAPSILTLLNQTNSNKGSKMILENGIHKLVGAMQLHTISNMEEHMTSEKKDERLETTNLQKYYDEDTKQRELYSGETVVSLDSLSGLSLKTELITFQQFRQGVKTIEGSRGEALSSLLFESKEDDQKNGAAVAQKETEKRKEKDSDIEQDRRKVRDDHNKSHNKHENKNSRDVENDKGKKDVENEKKNKDRDSQKRKDDKDKDMRKDDKEKDMRKENKDRESQKRKDDKEKDMRKDDKEKDMRNDKEDRETERRKENNEKDERKDNKEKKRRKDNKEKDMRNDKEDKETENENKDKDVRKNEVDYIKRKDNHEKVKKDDERAKRKHNEKTYKRKNKD